MSGFAWWSHSRRTLDTVDGERSEPIVNRAISVQARMSNALALGLMGALGTGLLLWYYSSTAKRPVRARQDAQAMSANKARDEMALPALGPISAPSVAATPDAQSLGSSATERRAIAAQPVPVAMPQPLASVADQPVLLQRGGYPSQTSVAAGAPMGALERELSGTVFANSSESQAHDGAVAPIDGSPAASGADAMASLLRPTVTPAARAQVLSTQRFLLPKGAFIDCTLETAIDSTLPGMTTCVTATDTFSADGSVVLMERGTKLVGETRGTVQQGAARVFVLWTEARTPTGVIVPLDSPGADELGRSGLPGEVERHFWSRFGAAILISTIDGAVQAAVQSTNKGGGTVIYSPGASTDVLTDVLKSTVNIPPTVRKQNGDRIQILVARDVNFADVYELRHAAQQ